MQTSDIASICAMIGILGLLTAGCSILGEQGGCRGPRGLAEEDVRPPWAHDSDRLVVCHYFNWFKTPEGRESWHNWEWKGNGPNHDPNTILEDGRRDIASVYYPLIGPYDSFDRDVIEYHMLTALAAKIDGFFVDWYGIPSEEEKGFPMLLDMAERFGFKMCICFEDKTMFGYHYRPKNRKAAIQVAITNLNYILETHAAHPAYLCIDGVPVIINFSWSEPVYSMRQHAHGFSAEEWKTILARVRENHDVYFVHDFHCHIRESYWDAADNFYPWLDANGDCLDRFYARVQELRSAGRIGFITSLVYPGFDNTGVWGWGEGPFVAPREDGAFYERLWERALSNDVRFLQIATWNDFGEGASIEPAVEYGFQYLEITERYTARLKGVPSDGAEGVRIPYAVYNARKAIARLKNEDPEHADELSDEVDQSVECFCQGRFAETARILSSVLDGAPESFLNP